MMIESAVLFGVPETNAMPAAIALELVHCYSLVHDDLPAMDNDDLRRGRPSVWKAYDEWTAILAGDALQALAFQVLAETAVSSPPGVTVRLVSGLARAAGAAGMVGGQCLDLEADKLGNPPAPDVAHVRRLQAMKTGALFRFACEAGAILGGAAAEDEERLASFGDAVGAAFQLADDLLDAEGDAVVVGKATGKDAAAGKATLIGLKGIEAARAELGRIEGDGRAALEPFGGRADVLRQALKFAVERTELMRRVRLYKRH